MVIPPLTEREILNSMLNGTITPEVMKDYALKHLRQLDQRNIAARNRAVNKRAIGDKLTEDIFNTLSDVEPMSREDIYEILKDKWTDLTIGKVSYRLSALVRERPQDILRQEATMLDDTGRLRKVIIYSRR